VQACGNSQALQGLILDETLADRFKDGHLLRSPLNLSLTRFGESDIFHTPFFQFSDCQSPAPRFWIPSNDSARFRLSAKMHVKTQISLY
jgi:hypothetical protein